MSQAVRSCHYTIGPVGIAALVSVVFVDVLCSIFVVVIVILSREIDMLLLNMMAMRMIMMMMRMMTIKKKKMILSIMETPATPLLSDLGLHTRYQMVVVVR